MVSASGWFVAARVDMYGGLVQGISLFSASLIFRACRRTNYFREINRHTYTADPSLPRADLITDSFLPACKIRDAPCISWI